MSRMLCTLLTVAVISLMAGTALAVTPASPFSEGTPLLAPNHSTLAPSDGGERFGPGEGMTAGADYLVHMQSDITEDNAGNGNPDGDQNDGGWDWSRTVFSHSMNPSEDNLYGVTATGIYYAYLLNPKPSYFTAMNDVATFGYGNPNIRTSSDMIFLMLFDDLPNVPGNTYRDAARAKFDGVIAAHGGSGTSFAQYLRDERGVHQGYPNGIIGWDLGAYTVAAAMLDARYPGNNYDLVADQIAEVLYQDSFNDTPGLFDIVDDAGWDPSYVNNNYWWYTLGVSGLIDAFRASGTYADRIPGLVARIQASTYPSGAVSGSYGAHLNDEDWQSTAYCAMALAALDPVAHRLAIQKAASWTASTQDPSSGAWLYSGGVHYPEVGAENTASLYFATSTVAPVPPEGCISTVNPCTTVPFTIVRGDASPLRLYHVVFTLSPELMLCDGLGSITEGTYLHGYNPLTQFQVLHNPDGSYTVDCAILGALCGPATSPGNLFNVAVKNSGSDGTGTITVNSVVLRDCNNGTIQGAPAVPGTITIDNTPPVAVSLAAAQLLTGNDADGTTKINISFTPPSGGGYSTTDLYRKGFGNYPEYDDAPGAGSVPSIPATPAAAVAAGWSFAGSSSSGAFADEPASRDFYYYIAFSWDGCGNVSAVSNMTGGTLNYHLGDVHNGTSDCAGNNQVNISDITFLGGHYGITLGISDPLGCLDVGPTTNYMVNARPTTDNLINFEDLIMFAINYGTVSFNGGSQATDLAGSTPAQEQPRLILGTEAAGIRGTLIARLRLVENQASVKGIHAGITYDASKLELLDVTPGALVQGETFFKHLPGESGITVDAAALGHDAVIQGSGEVAVLRFRIRAVGAVPSLKSADLRDRENRFLGTASQSVQPVVLTEHNPVTADAVPARLELLGARPNPFAGVTGIAFRLPSETNVSLRIFDAGGRLVRSLADGPMSAGEHSLNWDGRNLEGQTVGIGVYFYTFRAGDCRETRKLLMVR